MQDYDSSSGTLYLTFYSNNDVIPFHQVLEIWPQLKYLAYQNHDSLLGIQYEYLPKEPTTITHLAISNGRRYPPRDKDFDALLPLFPHLEYLSLSDCWDNDLPTITKHCPNLRRLIIGKRHTGGFPNDGAGTGLQHLAISGIHVNRDHLAELIAANSLETLKLDFTSGYKDSNGSGRGEWCPNISGPALKTLTLSIDSGVPSERWIVDCPALQDVTFFRCDHMDDSIFQSLKKLSNLRRLELTECPRLTHIGLSSFLDGNPEPLDTLVLGRLELQSTGVLDSVARVKNLRSLCIRSCNSFKGDAFNDFTSNIEELVLESISNLRDQALIRLVDALPKLQRLELHMLREITDDGVRAIANSSSLSTLKINVCPEISYRAINDLRKILDIQ